MGNPNIRWIELLAIGVVVGLTIAFSYIAKPVGKKNSYANAWDMFWGVAQVYDRAWPDTLVVNGNQSQDHPGEYYFWWHTPQSNLPIEQVMGALNAGEFKPWKRNPFRQPANGDEYWIYINIKNPFPKELSMLWCFDMYGTNAVLYQLANNSGHQRTDSASAHTHATKRPVKTMTPCIAFELPAHSTARYLAKLNKTVCRNLGLNMSISRTDGHTEYSFPLIELQAMVLGLYPFAIVLFLALYIIFKDRIYLFQCLYILVVGYWAIYSIFSIVLPESLYVPLSYMPQLLPATAASLLLTAIFRRFTEIDALKPRLAVYLQWAIWLNVASLAIHVFLYALYALLPHSSYWAIASILRWGPIVSLAILIPLLMYCALRIYTTAEKPHIRIYTGTTLFVLLLWGTHLSNMGGITNRTFVYPSNLLNALAIEIMVFTILMLFRFYQERKERIALLEQQLQLKQALTNSIVEAQESERKRIAQELHDGLGGMLVALRLMVNKRRNSLPNPDTSGSAAMFTEIQTNLDKVIKDVRDISHNLMPSDFEAKEFTDILREHIVNLNEHGDVKIEYYFDPNANRLDKSLQISLFRIITELIKNIHTHAHATLATVQIVMHRDSVVLQIEDNGTGFNHAQTTKGLGLGNVRSRVAFMNGTLTIDSNKLGSNIIVEIPFSNEQKQTDNS